MSFSPKASAKRKISFVLPVYNEEGNIKALFEELLKVSASLLPKYDSEFIFVNDGSRDNSIHLLKGLSEKDGRVFVVDFSRNFGHQAATTAGLNHSSGDAAIIMDTDLQDPPEVALLLVKKWEDGFDVVYAKRRSRKDSVFKRFTAFAFYRILNALSEVPIPTDTGDFRLMDRKVLNALSEIKETNRFLRGLTSYAGFNQTGVLFDRNERKSGETKYPLKKMVKFSIDAITSFSVVPLRLVSWLGAVVAGLSILGIFYALFMKFFFPEITVSGWTLLIISVFFIGGVQILSIGIIGSYVGRIFSEVKKRPLYIISKIYRKNLS
ncbi:MAG: glycosyltransferase [bacterium]|nr:glycosyltransferase [bacterium]